MTGKMQDLKGRAKEAVGVLTGDGLKREGKRDQERTAVKQKVSEVIQKVRDGIGKLDSSARNHKRD